MAFFRCYLIITTTPSRLQMCGVTLKIAAAAQCQLHHNGHHYLHDGQEQMAQGMHHYNEESLIGLDTIAICDG